MKQYYKARVVVDHRDGDCIVEVKRKWYSKWEFQRSFPTGTHCSATEALNRAKQCCDKLMSNMVVYESSGD